MVCPLVSDGEGLHVQTFAANIFNNQSQMAERGWFSSGRIERGTKLLTVYFQHVTVSVQRI
jgi:predicted  nucleic acid-binding Zn ribbon protein